MADTTHQVTYENRGIKFLVGIAILFLIGRLLWTGWLSNFTVLASASLEGDSSDGLGFGGVDLLIQLLIESVVALGGATLLIVTGLWRLFISQIRAWKARQDAKESAERSALQFASGSAGAQAAVAASMAGHQEVAGDPGPKARKALQDHERYLGILERRLRKAEETIGLREPPPPPPKTVEEQLADAMEVIQALEKKTKAASKPATKSSSRTTSRRRTSDAKESVEQ